MTMFQSTNKSRFTLGVYKAPSGLRGALVRHHQGRMELVAMLGQEEEIGSGRSPELSSVSIGPGFRQTNERVSAFAGDGFAMGGDGSAGAPDIFLTSEFGRVQVAIPEPAGLGSDLLQEDLARLLDRSRTLGAVDLDLVWCLGTAHFSIAEIEAQDTKTSPRFGKKSPRELSVTIEAAPAENGSPRRFVSTAKKEEPASAVIEALRTRSGQMDTCVVDSEITSLAALLKIAQGDDSGVSLLLRLSEDDLVVLASDNGQIRHVEVLRSLSIHDGPDMLYSRLLLLLDEFGIASLDRVYIASLVEDSRFVETFETYFRGVEVADLRDKLGAVSSERFDGEALPAIGAALRGVLNLKSEDNLLAVPLRRLPQANPFSWPVLVLLVVLGITAVFFVQRYMTFDGEISARHNRIEALTHDTRTAAMLRHRIDSLQTAYSVNMQGMQVLDSLLVGSDKWSRTFDETASAMAQVGGIWMEKWQPAGSIVDISGGARSKAGVVAFARRLNGTIETITYPTGDRTHYTFRMKAPITVELPEAARFLRERASEVTQL